MDEAARRLTWFGLSPPVGTPDYMAPEQVRGKRGDVRTDIYALGTMLYEMITGGLPYEAGNAHAMMRAKLNQNARPPRELLPSLDPKIEEIIVHAIEREPRERYMTAKDMLRRSRGPLAGRHSRPFCTAGAASARSDLLSRAASSGPPFWSSSSAALFGLTLKTGRPASHRGPKVPAPDSAPSGEH